MLKVVGSQKTVLVDCTRNYMRSSSGMWQQHKSSGGGDGDGGSSILSRAHGTAIAPDFAHLDRRVGCHAHLGQNVPPHEQQASSTVEPQLSILQPQSDSYSTNSASVGYDSPSTLTPQAGTQPSSFAPFTLAPTSGISGPGSNLVLPGGGSYGGGEAGRGGTGETREVVDAADMDERRGR